MRAPRCLPAAGKHGILGRMTLWRAALILLRYAAFASVLAGCASPSTRDITLRPEAPSMTGPLATVRVADARPPAARVSRNDAVIADLAYVGDASFAFEDVVVRALKSLSAKVAAATR